MTIEAFLRPSEWLEEATGPRYVRLRTRIEAAISTGLLAQSAPLPAEREIASLSGLSRVTVRRAMQDLVDRGIVVQRQGSGSFVSDAPPRVEQSLSRLTSFTEDMAARGRKVHSNWLVRESGLVTPEESLSLSLSPGSAVFRFHRIRYADNVAMALEYSSIAGQCLVSHEQVEDSLYEALRARKHNPVRALQRLRAVLFSDNQAELLDIDPGSPGLLIERIGDTVTRHAEVVSLELDPTIFDTAFEVTVDDMVMAPRVGSGVIPRPSSHERPYLAYCVTVSVASISQPGMIPANSVNTAAPAMVTPTASGTRMGSLFSAGVPVHTVSMMRR